MVYCCRLSESSEKGLDKKESYHRAGKLYDEINRYSRKTFFIGISHQKSSLLRKLFFGDGEDFLNAESAGIL